MRRSEGISHLLASGSTGPQPSRAGRVPPDQLLPGSWRVCDAMPPLALAEVLGRPREESPFSDVPITSDVPGIDVRFSGSVLSDGVGGEPIASLPPTASADPEERTPAEGVAIESPHRLPPPLPPAGATTVGSAEAAAVQAPISPDLGSGSGSAMSAISPERLAALIAEQRQLIERMAEVSARLQLRNQFAVERPGTPDVVVHAAEGQPILRTRSSGGAASGDLALASASAAAVVRRETPDPAATGLVKAIAVALTVVMPGRTSRPLIEGKAADSAPRAHISTEDRRDYGEARRNSDMGEAHAAPSPMVPRPSATPSPLPAFVAGLMLACLASAGLYAVLMLA